MPKRKVTAIVLYKYQIKRKKNDNLLGYVIVQFCVSRKVQPLKRKREYREETVNKVFGP